MYNLIIRPLLFCIDPEKVHRMLLSWLKFYRYLFPVRACVRGYSRVSDPFSYGHLQFKNRIGLSAGFDKNAEAFDELADFGFGFLEVGTVTPDSQSGNPSPRIFRLVDDESLISRTGFNNCGVDAVRQHIRKYRKHSYVLGVNINKNPLSTGDQIVKDFESTFIHLYDCVDYFTLNWGSIDNDLFAMVLEKLTIFRQAANNSVGCQACPALSTTLKAIQEEQPGRLAVASFHMDFGGMTDPMSTAATNNYRTNILGNFSGLPRFFYNLRKGTKEMISIKSQIEEELQKELSNYLTSCGVAVESVYNASDRTVKITAKLTSNVTNTYRCLIYLVEDGIKYFQTNGANDYTHNNVVRAVVSTSLNGDRFNGEVNAGVESTMQRSYQLEPGWNVDNMRVIVSMLTTLDGGKTYTCNNVNECKLGESADYLYNE